MQAKQPVSMYRVQVNVDKFAPQYVLDLVALLVERGNPISATERRFKSLPRTLPNHPFFKLECWFNLLRNTTAKTQRFVSHIKGGVEFQSSTRFKPMAYTNGRSMLYDRETHLELRAVGITEFEEQDFALFLDWLMPHLAPFDVSDDWLVMVQSYAFYREGASRRRSRRGLVKCYRKPYLGTYPRLSVLRGHVTDLPAYIL